MTGSDGKDLETEGLGLIAQGLTAALGELKELGMVGEAGAGRGFSDIALSGLQLGHEGLTGELKTFCDRWEWGVRALVGEGNALAAKTGMSAGAQYETEHYLEGSFKVATNAAVGNPYASEDEIEKTGWGDIVTSGASTDFSKESFDRALANSEQGWKDAGRDVMTSHTLGPLGPPGLNPENLHGAFGISDDQYNQYLDNTFGPSPEARAEAAQQDGED
ncbi:hypothetical protein [Streptomyces montanisoli]|uniref:Uncharacterized protein n=1 Tax=Streptomyces montanisoli TaxID=2798581 RepID=A0A940MG79_9ACTN|nr:hypothetical protein [Streptomyces montanisoli]MBP0458611.1 hypothetical protein [Streptomyces montanisoli]